MDPDKEYEHISIVIAKDDEHFDFIISIVESLALMADEATLERSMLCELEREIWSRFYSGPNNHPDTEWD